jgi:putative tryptophan/tyrosine transport system substrate-binding protein
VGAGRDNAALPMSIGLCGCGTADDEFRTRGGPDWRAEALIVVTSVRLFSHRKAIADLALKWHLPTAYHGSDWVVAGGLMSYSADDLAAFRRVAYYIDRILKGARPRDLPVEQPSKFRLVINQKTARALGLFIPLELLAFADEVIE